MKIEQILTKRNTFRKQMPFEKHLNVYSIYLDRLDKLTLKYRWYKSERLRVQNIVGDSGGKVNHIDIVLSFRFSCGSVSLYIAQFFYCDIYMTTFAPLTIENLCVHKLTLPHENLKLKTHFWNNVRNILWM